MPPMLTAMAVSLGIPLGHAVTAAGAYFMAYGLSQPFWGFATDRWGRVRILRITLILAGAFSLLSTLSWNALSLIVLRALAGGFFGAAYPTLLIYLGDTVALPLRQRAIARLMVGVALGISISSIAAGAVAQLWSWRMMFLVTGLSAIVLAIALKRLPEPAEVRRKGRSLIAPLASILRSRYALMILGLAVLEGVVLMGVLTLLPPAAQYAGAPLFVGGLVTAAFGVAVYACSPLVGRLSQRTRSSRLIATGALSALAACVILAFDRNPGLSLVSALLLGMSWVTLHSSLQTWATEVLPEARATVVSLFAASLFFGSALAAAAAAAPADAGLYGPIFVVAALVAIPLGVISTFGRHTWEMKSQE